MTGPRSSPNDQDDGTRENSRDVAPLLGLFMAFPYHFIKLDRAQLRRVCSWFSHMVIFSHSAADGQKF